MTVRQVTAKFIADIGGYISPLKAATQATKDFKSELSKAASAGKLDAVASMATKAGLALAGGFLLAESAAARFEKAMSEVSAVTNAGAADMKALSDAALQAGKDTSFSASEAAKAEAELGKAGLSTSEILGGALSGSLSLAAAGGLDLSEAADVAAKAMNVFGLEGKDVAHIADVLAAGANKSATDVHELGMALKMGGLAAKNAGLSLEETVGTLSAFADNALVGSDGGTSFKTMLQMLAAPSAEATKRMKELGIEAYDAGGNFVGIAKFAGNLQTGLKNLTMEQRNEALATIFGADAMRAATILYNEGEKGIRDYTAAVDDQGAAADMARKKTDNLMGDIERLTGSLETLFIESGSGANGGLRALVKVAEQLVDAFGSLPAPVLSTGLVIIGVAGAGLLAFSAFVKARNAFSDAIDQLTEMGPVGARAATGISRVARVAGAASVAMAGFAVAQQIVGETIAKDLDPQLDALTVGLKGWASSGKASGEIAKLFGDDMSKLDTSLKGATSSSKGFGLFWEEWSSAGILKAADGSLTKSVQRIEALDKALAGLVSSGDAAAAGQAFGLIQQRADALGISVEALRNQFPQYVAALEVAGPAAAEQAAAATQTTKANIALAGAFGEAASQADGLSDAFDALNGRELSWRDAERKAEQAVDDLTDALVASNGSLDVHNEKGRAAAAATDELAQAAADAAQKKYDETGSVEEANVAYQGYIEQLRIALLNAGWTEGAVDELIQKIAQMPQYKATTFVISADSSAYWTEYGRVLAARYQRWGGVTTHAATGALREAATFSPQSPARYAFAEPATKGEAFVPKSGNYGKSMSILNTAAGWYNADVVPRGGQGWYGGNMGSGGGTQQIEVVLSVKPGADRGLMREIINGLRADVTTVGAGSVQDHLGRRGRV